MTASGVERGLMLKCRRGQWLGLLAGLLFLAACASPRYSIDLLAELPLAVEEPADWPNGWLGEDALAPFCGGPWVKVKGRERRSLPGSPYLRFEVWQKVPLALELSGRTQGGGARVAVALNSRGLGSIDLGDEVGQFRFEIPAAALREGENQLFLRAARDCLWSEVRLRPSQAVVTTPEAPVGSMGLSLSSARHLALDLSGRSRVLRADEARRWSLPGAPPAQARLLVRVRSAQPPYDESWVLPAEQPVEVPLPDDLRRVLLTLMAVPEEEATLQGQLGLELVRPRIEARPRRDATPTSSPASPRVTSPQTAPNVVLYVIDTLRADHLSCYGYPRQTSPHLDALARDGVRFLDVTAQSSWTKAATASILTGLPPSIHGAVDFGDLLRPEVVTLGELLEPTHQTVAFTTNGFASGNFHLTQGFREFHLFGASAAQIHASVVSWLETADPGRPFFLYIHTMDPHLPYAPPKRFNRFTDSATVLSKADMERLIRSEDAATLTEAVALYDGEILANDDAFGLLMAEIKRRGLYEGTLVLVTSDHGEEFFEHGGYGHGRNLYQESVSVPWILKLPGQAGAGTVVEGAWQHLDMAPTILASVGISAPPSMQGIAYRPGLRPGSRDILTSLWLGSDGAPTEGVGTPWVRCDGLRQDSLTYLECRSQLDRDIPPRGLFDLASDPGQSRSLLNSGPVRLAHFRKRLARARPPSLPTTTDAPPETVNVNLRGLQYLE